MVCFSSKRVISIILTFGVLNDCAASSAKSQKSSSAGTGKGHETTSASSVGGEVVAHIKCQICEIGVQQARRHARNHSISTEDELTDFVDNLCSLRHAEGRWLTKVDITQKSDAQTPIASPASKKSWPWNWLAYAKAWLSGTKLNSQSPRRVTAEDPLTVVVRDESRECLKECSTVQKTCKSWLNGKEEQLVGMLLKSEGVIAMRKQICKKPCAKRWDELPRLDTWVDEPFKPMPKKWSHTQQLTFSPGDLEAMAAREKYEKERQTAQSGSQDL